jgi:hypothetical protein
MRDIHSKIGLELRRRKLSNWTGGIFHKRRRPILVANAEDPIARQKYCLSNSTKEHLVTRPNRVGRGPRGQGAVRLGTGVGNHSSVMPLFKKTLVPELTTGVGHRNVFGTSIGCQTNFNCSKRRYNSRHTQASVAA